MTALDSNTLFGNWATLLLATHACGKIDLARMGSQIDLLIASKPNGIYSNGTAGEFYAQSTREFEDISKLLALKCESANIPFQIGVSHSSAQESLRRLNIIKELSPSAVQLILPDWFAVNDREAVMFLEKMAQVADQIPLVLYNPPHAKRNLTPQEFGVLKKAIPQLIGLKVSDHNKDESWYAQMRDHCAELSVFIPGHHLATGIKNGAKGAYSNVACLNPFAAQRWYELICKDIEQGLELEQRICQFMSNYIAPFIAKMRYGNHACDRFMAVVGGWADVGESMQWPYESIPSTYVGEVRGQMEIIIPEFATLNI